MNGPIEWLAALGTIIAASLIAADLGRRVTGWGFVLFCVVAATWVYSGLTSPEGMPIAVMNMTLFVVNAYGVWQFLLSPRKIAEIEKAEDIAEQAKDQAAEAEGEKA